MNSDIGMNYANNEAMAWAPAIDGPHATEISEVLKRNHIPAKEVSKILCNSARTISFCPDPFNDAPQQFTGIVIGKVQSGKTSNFLTSIAIAFDNGYNLMVVLGGTKKVLVKQNRERLEEHFRAMHDVVILDSYAQKSQLESEKIIKLIKRGKKVIIVSLKTPKMINFITDHVFTDSNIASKPVLIIDDEGDEASLNIYVSKNKESSTYRAIRRMKDSLVRHCFLTITATPQANLLIEAMDVLSPDFGILVEPGEGYCGLDTFHSDSQFSRTIPESEPTILDDGVPESFIEALSSFFVACAIRKHWGMDPDDHLSMLIHPSSLKQDHKQVFNKVEELTNKWRMIAKNPYDIAFEDLEKHLEKAYEDYNNSEIILRDIPAFEDLIDNILYALEYFEMHLVNGDSVPNKADENYEFNIYVGGNMLGRGLTLSGLAITYIIRTAKGSSNVDTVQQRARWFGYKQGYLSLCRVFAVSKILNEFRAIRDHEEDLWQTIENSRCQGKNFKDMPRIFTLSDGLNPTNSARVKVKRYNFPTWVRQRIFLRDHDYSKSNLDMIDDFKNNCHPEVATFGSGSSYFIAKDIPFDDVKQQLFKHYIFPEDSNIDFDLIEELGMVFLKKGISPLADVVWMRWSIDSKHDISEEGRIGNYSVGRRPENKNLAATYLGDDKQFSRGDRIIVQIHRILDRNTGEISPTLSINVPNSLREKLVDLVARA